MNYINFVRCVCVCVAQKKLRCVQFLVVTLVCTSCCCCLNSWSSRNCCCGYNCILPLCLCAHNNLKAHTHSRIERIENSRVRLARTNVILIRMQPIYAFLFSPSPSLSSEWRSCACWSLCTQNWAKPCMQRAKEKQPRRKKQAKMIAPQPFAISICHYITKVYVPLNTYIINTLGDVRKKQFHITDGSCWNFKRIYFIWHRTKRRPKK